MNQPARSSRARQEPVAAFSPSDVWLDVEVLADRHKALAALSPLEDDPPVNESPEEADADDEEASDDLPF